MARASSSSSNGLRASQGTPLTGMMETVIIAEVDELQSRVATMESTIADFNNIGERVDTVQQQVFSMVKPLTDNNAELEAKIGNLESLNHNLSERLTDLKLRRHSSQSATIRVAVPRNLLLKPHSPSNITCRHQWSSRSEHYSLAQDHRRLREHGLGCSRRDLGTHCQLVLRRPMVRTPPSQICLSQTRDTSKLSSCHIFSSREYSSHRSNRH